MRSIHFIIFILFLCIFFPSCKERGNRATDNSTTDTTQYIMTPEFYDFEEINAGDIVGYTFTLKNVGKSNLIIKDVKTDCPCTTIELQKKSRNPNDSCKIDIEFNSAGRNGFQMKEIRIFANVKNGVIKLPFSAIVN